MKLPVLRSRQVAVPISNKDIKPGTLRGIIKQAEMTPEEFLKWRK